ncbi:MAG: type II toxin-antitoxin system HicA family toxin [Thermomicrobiales bacterium]
MTKSEKREQAIRQSTRNVRFDDLDLLLRSYDFLPTQKGSHVTYEHATYDDQRVTVVRPHGGATQIKPVYVRGALLVIDIVRARIAEERQEAAKD